MIAARSPRTADSCARARRPGRRTSSGRRARAITGRPRNDGSIGVLTGKRISSPDRPLCGGHGDVTHIEGKFARASLSATRAEPRSAASPARSREGPRNRVKRGLLPSCQPSPKNPPRAAPGSPHRGRSSSEGTGRRLRRQSRRRSRISGNSFDGGGRWSGNRARTLGEAES
jgi:hypothetical protein